MYNVRLTKFEGPLDLLLELIEANKLDITEISLATVTEQYLEHLEKMKDIEINYLADFLVIASRLILLKSKMLLPKFEITEDEEQDIFELKRQLELYQKFKKISPLISKLFVSDKVFMSRNIGYQKNTGFYPPKRLKANDLRDSFKVILADMTDSFVLPQRLLVKSISIKEKIEFIKSSIISRIKSTFKELVKDSESKSDVVVSFLAVLDLLKNKFIYAEQKMPFSEIELFLNSHNAKSK